MTLDASANGVTNKVGTSNHHDRNIVKQGYVEKFGASMLSGWKERFIVLYDDNTIEYYTDNSKTNLNGTINIHPCNLAIKDAYEAVRSHRDERKFDIKCLNRTWEFRCEYDTTARGWVHEIRRSITNESEYNSSCPDIYHCCLELLVKNDKWIRVWPLLKLDDKNDDEKKNNDMAHDCDMSDKILYLFENRQDRDNEKKSKAMKIFHIPTGFYDIYEYFPSDFSGDQHYCILKASEDQQFMFKCRKAGQRWLFIDAICEKIYYQNDGIDCKYTLKTRNHCKFTFKYKPIYYHIKYDQQQSGDCNKWWHIPIIFEKFKYKFVLSIEHESSFVVTMSDLKAVINVMVQSYFVLHENKTVSFRDHQPTVVMRKMIEKYGDSATAINAKDQLVMSRYGIFLTHLVEVIPNSTIPHLSGIGTNCNKNSNVKDVDDTKMNDNNNNNNGMDVNNNECKYGFDCEIYKKVKNSYEYNEYNYKHLVEKNHYQFDYSNKPPCRHGSECKAFKRISRMNEDPNDFNCHRFDDLCHLAIYRHPPRIYRNDCIMKNLFDKYQSKKKKDNNMHQFKAASKVKEIDYDCSLNGLISEVINNGFEKDLCLNSDDLKNKHYSLLKIVNEKFQSKYQKICYKNAFLQWSRDHTRALMLSLLLYTGCSCNYDLCKSQRDGNYKKWKCYDACLYKAISYLSCVEDYSRYCNDKRILFQLYSGLNKVQLKSNSKIHVFYFPTYISTSYDKKISVEFAQNDGMLMQFDSNVVSKRQFTFCSLEWISKFEYECEILIARTRYDNVTQNAATMRVMDCEMNTLAQKNNKSLQIVHVNHLGKESNGVALLSEHERNDFWRNMFLSGTEGKANVLEWFDKCYHGKHSKKDFEIALSLIYNDSAFQSYCQKFKENKDCELNQIDIINMQMESKVMKRLIRARVTSVFCGIITSGAAFESMYDVFNLGR